MPFSTKFWGTCSIFSVLFSLSSSEIMIYSWSQIRTRIESMHDSLSTPPSPKSTFSDDQTTNPESADHYFVPDLQATLMNSNQGNIHTLPLYYLPKYSRGGGVRTVPTRGDLKPLQIPVYLLMKHFRNWRARQPTNHYFEQPRTAATGNNCPPIPGPNQGMTLIPWVAKRQSYLYFTLVNFLKVSQPKYNF